MANKKSNTTHKLNKQREIELKKRKKRKVLMLIILILLIVVCIIVYLLKSEKFKIQEIIVTGNEQISYEEICDISYINIGDNIFSTIGIVAEVRLKENSYIKDAEIKKIYPNKIEIVIQERTKEYQILTSTGYYINIDSQGYIIDYSLDKLDLPLITGMEITEEQVSSLKRLEENDLDKMENILHIQDEGSKIELSTILQIDTEDEYIIHIENDTILINLGDASDLTDKMYYVKAILKAETGNSGTIYVNGDIKEGFAPYFSAN